MTFHPPRSLSPRPFTRRKVASVQASILTLYDPERPQTLTQRGRIRTWDDFQAELNALLEKQSARQGAGLRLLTGTITSPTLA